MNRSYFRIKLNMEEAIKRLYDWNEREYKEQIETKNFNAVKVSLDQNGQRKGDCLYVYENEGWTVFENYVEQWSARSCSFAAARLGSTFIDVEQWLRFAKDDEFVFAAYNDAILYAKMIVIVDGIVTKYFIEDFDMPEDNINEGDGVKDINSWVDVAGFVDEDEYVYSDGGVVLIF